MKPLVRAVGMVLVLVGVASGQGFDAMTHPVFPLLDAGGRNVLDSGDPVSTMETCSGCHNTGYIASHSGHADIGMSRAGVQGKYLCGRDGDVGPGLYGRWSPLRYRRLTRDGDNAFDLGLADFLRSVGSRHAGGGPAERTPDGTPLEDLPPRALETRVLDPATGKPTDWDWQASGTVEMNCFLCHIPEPNNPARIEQLQAGRFRWANTATLLDSGLLERDGEGGFRWDPDAFDASGRLELEFSQMEKPGSFHCGQCHGRVHEDPDEVLTVDLFDPASWNTLVTGEIFSPIRVSDSGMNLEDKTDTVRSFDIHSERLIGCVDCHHSVNNPAYHRSSPQGGPDHLRFDPRRMNLREYLYRPSHILAAGPRPDPPGSARFYHPMRDCVDCHDPETGHEWLPFRERHVAAMDCEVCHIPRQFAPARMMTDWTLPAPDGAPRTEHRGIDGAPDTVNRLVRGFRPALLLRDDGDAGTRLAPYNLITSSYWVAGDPERPVRMFDLEQALHIDGAMHPDILVAFDADGNAALDDAERILDRPEKIDAVKHRLAAVGIANARIRSDVEPYPIHHGVTGGRWAIRECTTCHGAESILYQPVRLASALPAGTDPAWVLPVNLRAPGATTVESENGASFALSAQAGGYFILGHDAAAWSQQAGAGMFLLVLAGIIAHSAMRYLSRHRRSKQHPPQAEWEQVYLYTAYQRFWHWLQATAIIGLIVTGLVIHDPTTWAMLNFALMVRIHNILGFVLLFNAFFSLFYHFASEQIRHYLPEPQGFFSQIIDQLHYYLYGIFRGEEHPFEKTSHKKLNPLQRLTYLVILNVLLPLQIVTGFLIWGAQRWPALTERLGSLPVLVPIHSFGAWTFAAFLMMHIYLTTTGHTLTSNLKAMVTGWEDLKTGRSAG